MKSNIGRVIFLVCLLGGLCFAGGSGSSSLVDQRAALQAKTLSPGRIIVSQLPSWIKQVSGLFGGQAGKEYLSFSRVLSTGDGGFVLGGDAILDNPPDSLHETVVLKMGSSGQVEWLVSYPADPRQKADCHLAGLIPTRDGGYLMAAQSGQDTILLMKLSPGGVVLWMRSYGPGSVGGSGCDVAEASDGGYVIAASTLAYYGAAQKELLVFKVDDLGSIVWQKAMGTPDYDTPSEIQAAPDGGFLVAGQSWAETSCNCGGGGRGFILKLSADGERIWHRSYSVPEDYGTDVAFNSFVPNADGSIVLSGVLDAGGGHTWPQYVLVCKLDGSQELTWHASFNRGQADSGSAIAKGRTSGYLVMGDSGAWKISKAGNVVWQRTYVTTSLPRPVQAGYQREDAGHVLTAGNMIINLGPWDMEPSFCSVIRSGKPVLNSIPLVRFMDAYAGRDASLKVGSLTYEPYPRSIKVETICASNSTVVR